MLHSKNFIRRYCWKHVSNCVFIQCTRGIIINTAVSPTIVILQCEMLTTVFATTIKHPFLGRYLAASCQLKLKPQSVCQGGPLR